MLAAALIGSDYNHKGVLGVGDKKATDFTRAALQLYREHRQCGDKLQSDEGFLQFAQTIATAPRTHEQGFKQHSKSAAFVLGKIVELHEQAPGQTDPKGEPLPPPFAQQLQTVVGTFKDERRRAAAKAAELSRAATVWSGDRLDRQALISALEASHIEHQAGATDTIFMKVLLLEAERAVRYGEARRSEALIEIVRIAKPKAWYKPKQAPKKPAAAVRV